MRADSILNGSDGGTLMLNYVSPTVRFLIIGFFNLSRRCFLVRKVSAVRSESSASLCSVLAEVELAEKERENRAEQGMRC